MANPAPAAAPGRDWVSSLSGRRDGDTALEQSLDEAMARQAEAAAQAELEHRPSTPAPAETLSSGTLALSVPAQPGCSALVAPTHLSWKGLAVSDDFRRYAERVARGEELLPYRGQVLAQHSDAFPWGLEGRPERGRRGPRASKSPAWLLGLGALLGAALVSGVRAAVVASGGGTELTRAVSALEAERSAPPTPAPQLDPQSASGSVSRLLGNAEVASEQLAPLAAAAPASGRNVEKTSTPRRRLSATRRAPAHPNAPSPPSPAAPEAHGSTEAPLPPPLGALPFREEAAIFERAPSPTPTALLLELAPF